MVECSDQAKAGPIVAVVGNPKAGSRTLRVAEFVGARIAALVGGGDTTSIDLGVDALPLLHPGHPAIAEMHLTVLSARALIVASPTYKASYTGLLKLFLDTFEHDELGGLPTVALMTGGSADHGLAVQLHLTPVLVEIGASCPARGLYVAGPAINDPESAVDKWLATAGRALEWAIASREECRPASSDA